MTKFDYTEIPAVWDGEIDELSVEESALIIIGAVLFGALIVLVITAWQGLL